MRIKTAGCRPSPVKQDSAVSLDMHARGQNMKEQQDSSTGVAPNNCDLLDRRPKTKEEMSFRGQVGKVKVIKLTGDQEVDPKGQDHQHSQLKRDNSQPEHQIAPSISLAKPSLATTSLCRNPSTSNPHATLPLDHPQSSRRSLEFDILARNSAFERLSADQNYSIQLNNPKIS